MGVLVPELKLVEFDGFYTQKYAKDSEGLEPRPGIRFSKFQMILTDPDS